MASGAMAMVCSRLPQGAVLRHQNRSIRVFGTKNDSFCLCVPGQSSFRRSLYLCGGDTKHMPRPICAVKPGLETSITNQKKNDLSLDNVNVAVESRDDEKIYVRVELTGEQTQKAFDEVLRNLARTAPPIPGFRRMKGGKTSNVPKSFLLQMLGKDRVTKFLIQEIISASVDDYVKKENIKVKSQVTTTQTADELEAAFTPGNDFGFNATIELDKPDGETTSTEEPTGETES